MKNVNEESLLLKLKIWEVVPNLDLPSNRNGNISLWNFKQRKHLVIIFHHGSKCSFCRNKLKDFAEVYKEIQKLEAEVLAVSFESIDQLKRQAEEDRIPFPMLSDAYGEATESFTYMDEKRKGPFPSVFITDRYGELRKQEVGTEADKLLSKEEILSWLLLLETECPECSHL
jgi:peroxiredoxin